MKRHSVESALGGRANGTGRPPSLGFDIATGIFGDPALGAQGKLTGERYPSEE
jgi:hypothetical protein